MNHIHYIVANKLKIFLWRTFLIRRLYIVRFVEHRIKTRIAIIIPIAIIGMLVNSAAVGIPTAHSSSDNTKDKQSADESKKQLQSDEKQLNLM